MEYFGIFRYEIPNAENVGRCHNLKNGKEASEDTAENPEKGRILFFLTLFFGVFTGAALLLQLLAYVARTCIRIQLDSIL